MLSSSPHTQPKYSKEILVTRSLFGPPGISALANRFTRRYGLFQGFHGSQEGFCVDSSEEDDDGVSDSESSEGSNTSALNFKNLEQPPPRVVLLELPIEILEHIAASMRDPVPVLEAASHYIDDRFSDFSEARFTLSALSKVCSTLRRTVERILYRDVQLDFTGWKGRKHTKWPAGSLRLLLRTLEERPELGRYIYAAALDYQLSSESIDLEKGLEKFLNSTPNLKTLFLGQCPLVLWDFPHLKLETFATTYAQGILPSILEHFPKLENLYLRDCHVMNFSSNVPAHKLKTVRLDSSHDYALEHFIRALSLCCDTVDHLDLRFLGGLLQPSPIFTLRIFPLKSSPATNLRSLRLDNISVFSHTCSGYAQALQALPALQDLHVTNHNCFSPDAFTILPLSLHTLTVSDYYGYWEPIYNVHDTEPRNFAFLKAIATCISFSSRGITRVIGSAGKGNNSSDLEVVSAACMVEDFKEFKVVGRHDAFIQIAFRKP